MRAVRFTARSPLFRVIPDLEFRSGQWTRVQIDELSREQLDGLVAYHGTHLGIHPDDAEALAEHGLVVDGRNQLALAPVVDFAPAPAAAPVVADPAVPAKGSRKRG